MPWFLDFFVSLQQKYTSLMKIKSQWLLYFRFHNWRCTSLMKRGLFTMENWWSKYALSLIHIYDGLVAFVWMEKWALARMKSISAKNSYDWRMAGTCGRIMIEKSCLLYTSDLRYIFSSVKNITDNHQMVFPEAPFVVFINDMIAL